MLKQFETKTGARMAPDRLRPAAANARAETARDDASGQTAAGQKAAGKEAAGKEAVGEEVTGEEQYLRAALDAAVPAAPEPAAAAAPKAGAESDEAQGEASSEDIEDTEAAEAAEEDAAESAGSEDPAELQQQVHLLQEQLEQLKQSNRRDLERMIRALAEAENQRKRAEADVQRERKFGNETLLKALLPVADSLELALQHSSSANSEQKTMFEGVQNTLVLLLKVLKDFGVEQLNPQGEMFNPKVHQAISTLENAQAKPGQILQVMQKGFTLNGRVVRPAMVVVPRAPAAPEGENGSGGNISIEA